MIDPHLALKLAHVIGACVLFGTGMGIAFFMWMAHRTADAADPLPFTGEGGTRGRVRVGREERGTSTASPG